MEPTSALASIYCQVAKRPGPPPAGLEQRLEEMLEAGRGAWPGIDLAAQAFVTYLAERAQGGELASLDALQTSDLYLACGIAQRSRVALEHFERQFIARVGEYLVRVTVDPSLVDEVKQTLREAIVLGTKGPAKIAEYSGKGALGGWIRISAVRMALNAQRGANRASPVDEDEPALSLDPELAYVKVRAQALFRSAFEKVLAALDPTERALLRLHYVEQLTFDQLARMYKTPRSTLARRVDQVRREILEEMEHLLREEHRLSASEMASVIRSAGSQIHLSFTKILK